MENVRLIPTLIAMNGAMENVKHALKDFTYKLMEVVNLLILYVKSLTCRIRSVEAAMLDIFLTKDNAMNILNMKVILLMTPTAVNLTLMDNVWAAITDTSWNTVSVKWLVPTVKLMKKPKVTVWAAIEDTDSINMLNV